jgi:hypothetical protein
MNISCGDAESEEFQFHEQLLEASLKFWRQEEQKTVLLKRTLSETRPVKYRVSNLL